MLQREIDVLINVSAVTQPLSGEKKLPVWKEAITKRERRPTTNSKSEITRNSYTSSFNFTFAPRFSLALFWSSFCFTFVPRLSLSLHFFLLSAPPVSVSAFVRLSWSLHLDCRCECVHASLLVMLFLARVLFLAFNPFDRLVDPSFFSSRGNSWRMLTLWLLSTRAILSPSDFLSFFHSFSI